MNQQSGVASPLPDAETLRKAIANFPIVIFHQDRDLRYEWIFNSAMGFRPEYVIGRTDSDLLEDAEDARNLETLKRKILETGVARRQQVRIGRGKLTRYYDLVINPSVDAAGNIDGLSCAAIDVTDRHETETALYDAEERLRLAVDSARIGTWHYDVATDTLFWSDRCREIFGVASDAPVTYERFLEMLHPDDRERTRREAEAAFAGENGGLYAGEYRIVRPDGAICWVIARGVPSSTKRGGRCGSSARSSTSPRGSSTSSPSPRRSVPETKRSRSYPTICAPLSHRSCSR